MTSGQPTDVLSTAGADDLEPGQARLVDCSEQSYHANTTYLSRSMIEDWRRRQHTSPESFAAKWITREIKGSSESAAMRFGRLFHLVVLEPERIPSVYAEDPFADGVDPLFMGQCRPLQVPKRQRAARLELWEKQAQDLGATLAKPAEFREALLMAERVRRHEAAAKLLSGKGHNEQTVLWREPTTSAVIRTRLDRVRMLGRDGMVVIDLKATEEPAPEGPRSFPDSIRKYGYHRQAAIYTDAIQAAFPDRSVEYVLIAVRSRPPYEVAVHQLGESWIERGRMEYTEDLRTLVERMKSADWTAPWQHGINILETT